MTKEKRPQDWSAEERLEKVSRCSALDDKAISELCRTKGLYPHHVMQWKHDFINGGPVNGPGRPRQHRAA